jgi:hypothetical protein
MSDIERKKISQFVDQLVDDPALEEEFLEHPRQIMKREGLQDDQIETVMDKPLRELRDAIETEEEGAARVVAFRIKMRP